MHLVAYQMLDRESSVQSAGSGCAGEATAAVSVMAMRGILIGLFPLPRLGAAQVVNETKHGLNES